MNGFMRSKQSLSFHICELEAQPGKSQQIRNVANRRSSKLAKALHFRREIPG